MASPVATSEKATCAGITKKGKPCKSKGFVAPGSAFYCLGHVDQEPEQAVTDVSEIGPSGTATTSQQEVLAVTARGSLLQCSATVKSRKGKEKTCANTGYAVVGLSTFLCADHAPKALSEAALTQLNEHLNKKEGMEKRKREEKENQVQLKQEKEKEDKETADKEKREECLRAEEVKLAKEKQDAVTMDANEESDTDLPGLPELDDFAEAVGGDVHPDELDALSGDDEEEPINDGLLHLREMLGQDPSDEEEESDMEEEEALAVSIDAYSEERIIEPSEWTWAMSRLERWAAVSLFLRQAAKSMGSLRAQAAPHVTAARKRRAEAGALSFRHARIIGATVVGAARRLEAIRAAQPFAVVVEEACEVMEPTLVGVLAVGSLRKLELVGDHRQLPAFVQNCWYNLASSNPSIKTSIFERLIMGSVGEGRDGHPSVPPLTHTILDEQRRMRPALSDITRGEYKDLVPIVDHAQTRTQRVGDALLREKNDQLRKAQRCLQLERNLWEGQGRPMPGVALIKYFWDLPSSKEGRADAGLSAANKPEAEACADLACFLVLCGVPYGAISIITPYKGQRMTIMNALQSRKALPRPDIKNKNQAPVPMSAITVSTIDKFQGDKI
jgi:hypothetical protein